MGLTVSDDIIRATNMTEDELRREFAVYLYSIGRLTVGQAFRLAGMDRIQFQRLLASRRISIYDEAEFDKDIETLRELSRL